MKHDLQNKVCDREKVCKLRDKVTSLIKISEEKGFSILIAEIKKIGGSVSKGGIKSTMSFYESANCGRPSIRSFGIQQLIFEELEAGKEVEIYLITSEQVIAPVKGLLGKKDVMISAFKEMEESCLSDYVQVEGDYPDWNFQESGRAWDTHIQQLHAQMLAESAS